MTERADIAPRPMTRSGRWGFSQCIEGEWSSTGSLGHEYRADAERELTRLDSIQPGRWRLRDRHVAVEVSDAA